MTEIPDEGKSESTLEDKVDNILSSRPEALRKVKDNRAFVKKLKTKKVKDEHDNVQVYGYIDVPINAILKDNIWNRSIFTTDKLCRMHLGATLEQLKKYEKKKRGVPLNFLWIILLILGITIVIVVIIFLLPKIQGVF